MIPRPKSLAEVAARSVTTGDVRRELTDFLHEFERHASADMLTTEPELLRQRIPEGAIWDAYLAATAQALALRFGYNPPRWTRRPERFLREPWFSSPGRHMRALLLLESPPAFRERNLFVTANTLSVA
jgi:hypothetical protein